MYARVRVRLKKKSQPRNAYFGNLRLAFQRLIIDTLEIYFSQSGDESWHFTYFLTAFG